MKININDVKDDLKGNWWHHIHTSHFGFLEDIADLKSHEAAKDDILIHKEIKEGERFPTIRYHVITEKGTKEVKNAEVKEILARKLVEYIKKNKKFPFACKLAKVFKNGSAQVNYAPTQFENFALKVIPKTHDISNAENFFEGLKTSENPLPSPITTGSRSKAKEAQKKWEIQSSKDPAKTYTVMFYGSGSWTCTCPNYVFRRTECRHIKECKQKL